MPKFSFYDTTGLETILTLANPIKEVFLDDDLIWPVDEPVTPPIEEPVVPPIEEPITPPATGDEIERPVGLAYAPDFSGKPFDPATDVPGDAMCWSDYDYASDDLALFLAKCVERNLPGYIDVPNAYDISVCGYVLPKGLYGCPGVMIRYTGSLSTSTPCFGYVCNSDFVMQGISFENFGGVIGVATLSVLREGMEKMWDLHGSSRSSYGSRRYMGKYDVHGNTLTSQGFNEVGICVNTSIYPLERGNTGPAITITDSSFHNCQSALAWWSDTLVPGTVNFHRNDLDGTFNGADIAVTAYSDFFAANNYWHDCTDDRYDGLDRRLTSGADGNRHHTCFKLGINDASDVDIRDHIVQIENNRFENIEDTHYSDGTNAAVCVDIRNVTPASIENANDPFTWTCSVRVGWNECIDCIGTVGQEDANPLYAKSRGILFECNDIHHCGSWYQDEKRNGPEGSAIEIKQTANMDNAPEGAAIVLRGNRIFDPPPKDKNPAVQSVIGTNDLTLPYYVIGNELHNAHITNTEGNAPSLIRTYGNTPVAKWICNSFHNCLIGEPAYLMGFHGLGGVIAGSYEISNNKAYSGPSVTYSGSQKLIGSTSSVSGAKVGLNTLHNGTEYPMTAGFGSSDGVVKREYKRPTVHT